MGRKPEGKEFKAGKESDIPNPLMAFHDEDGFVGRVIVDDVLYVRPILPKPDELAMFCYEAQAAGFEPGPEIDWGNGHWAPKYWHGNPDRTTRMAAMAERRKADPWDY